MVVTEAEFDSDCGVASTNAESPKSGKGNFTVRSSKSAITSCVVAEKGERELSARVCKTLPHAAGRAHLSSASWPRPRRLAEISALSLPRHLSTGHKYATRAGNVSDCDCAAKYCYMYVQNAFTASTVLAVNCVQCLSSRFLVSPCFPCCYTHRSQRCVATNAVFSRPLMEKVFYWINL